MAAQAQSLLDIYAQRKSELGVDKITYAVGRARETPYSTDDLQKADEQVLTADKFKVGRLGEINNVKYSDTVKR
jgi:hypothetical protein